ncbi:MAG: hypothetical protein H5U40_17125, partial [Polyangiaceae bacterium]|nr:hypothetical protein [Polyangiaceae bacterium]
MRVALIAGVSTSGCASTEPESSSDVVESAKSLGFGDLADQIVAALLPSGYNIHTNLYDARHQNFEPVPDGSDVDRGRALFGVAEDMQTQDASGALFEGDSVIAGEVVSNGRSCFTCHRGTDVNFGLAPPPMSASVPPDDPLFTGVEADGQGDP